MIRRYRDAYNEFDMLMNAFHHLDVGILPVTILNADADVIDPKKSIDVALSQMSAEDAHRTKRAYRKQKRRLIRKKKIVYENTMQRNITKNKWITRKMVYAMLLHDLYSKDKMWWY